ncbi:hypothetical protein FHS89_000863 [Rubricella aquisinus]|uniref:Uncharacterized protein n=1 Tax=Rubricella aquisinus TaxID=2028108 RepID=A0A840X2F6_9RHOB|nr:hypothetical protein [Rubricella aquisinus]MBB5514857.1 hypothetical protein [Rubricella aquisinus]
MGLADYPPEDPRGLIHEAYQMEIGPEECRSIFVDWAIGRLNGAPEDLIPRLIARYGTAQPDHPMTAVLTEGLRASSPPRRRGGRAGRVGS